MSEDSFEHLVLDLDGTLVHSVPIGCIFGLAPGEEHPETPTFKLRLSDGYYLVFGRPYIRHFLRFCFEKFKTVSVWTAGTRSYAEQVVEQLFEKQPRLLWTRKDCMQKDGCQIKPLEQMAFALGTEVANVRVLDDTMITFCLNRHQGLAIKRWSYLDTEDKHLLTLMVAWEMRQKGNHSQAFWIERSVAE